MLLKRTMDARALNGIANDPEVRPWLGGSGELDMSRVVANPANVALIGERGGFLGMKVQDGLYECHSVFLPEGRGEYARDAASEGLRYLFTVTDCMEVVTKCPNNNKAALGLARTMGFTLAFSRADAWMQMDGTFCGVDYMSLSYWKWLAKDQVVLERGAYFHERLEALTDKAIPVHKDDIAHNRSVGACALMLAAGNHAKAVETYNRWAAIAGQYSPIRLLSLSPVIIDADGVLIAPDGDDMHVLKMPKILPRQEGETAQ